MGVALLHGKALGGAAVAEALDEDLCSSFAPPGELNPVDPLGHLLVYLHGRCRLERWMPSEQLEGEDAKSPPVNGMSVAFGRNELWGEVVWGSARSESLAHHHLCQTHVGKLDMARIIKQ